MEQQTHTPEPSRQQVLDALLTFINKRTGMDIRNYASDWRDADGIKAFRSEYREILRAGKDARTLLAAMWWRHEVIPVSLMLQNATNGGRLQYENGQFHYIVGQYWCTEYRSAACRYLRDCYIQGLKTCGYDYEQIKKLARKELGRGLVHRWFY